jgi:hypothetical protein
MDTEVTSAIIGGIIAIGGAAVAYSYRIRHEASVVNKAVLAEIHRLLLVLRSHKEWWRKCMESNQTEYPLIPFATDVYTEQIKQIGKIDQSIIADVVKFYGYIGYLNALQSVRSQYKAQSEFEAQYLASMRTLLETYESAFESAYTKYGLPLG